MKKILYILFFIGFIGSSQVNMWTYDTGNGNLSVAEIQNAIDNETNLFATPALTGANSTFNATIFINDNQQNYIDWNGSVIDKIGDYDWMFIIDKRAFSNSLTSFLNLEIDGQNNGGKTIDIKSRVRFENIEIANVIHNNANGIRLLVYDDPGMYGQSWFENVNIHDMETETNNGSSGDNAGAVHGFLVSAQEVPSEDTQIVYVNSEIYNTWGEDGGGITINSPGIDTSNSPLSFWFENMSVRDAQRRTVKGFIGNQTWINSEFVSAAADNPKIVDASEGGLAGAGLFVIASSSSAQGATNNLVCGCDFKGNPSDPNDSWFTQVFVVAEWGPAGAVFRNNTFTGDHPSTSSYNGFTSFKSGNRGGFVEKLEFYNNTWGTGKTLRVVTPVSEGLKMNDDNTYADGSTAFFLDTNQPITTISTAFVPCPTILDGTPPAGSLTGLTYVNATNPNRIRFDENTVSPSATFLPISTNTGQTYSYAETGGGNDPTLFSISGDVLTLDLTPDFENPVDSNTNNIYALDVQVTESPSGETFTEDMIFYIDDVVDEASEVNVTGITFTDIDQTIFVGQTVDKAFTFTPANPDDTGHGFASEDINQLINFEGTGLEPTNGIDTDFRVIADDVTNGIIEDVMNVEILPKPNQGRGLNNKRFSRARR